MKRNERTEKVIEAENMIHRFLESNELNETDLGIILDFAKGLAAARKTKSS